MKIINIDVRNNIELKTIEDSGTGVINDIKSILNIPTDNVNNILLNFNFITPDASEVGLRSFAIFSSKNIEKSILVELSELEVNGQIYNKACYMPAETLVKTGIVTLGIFGYILNDDETLSKRVSLRPISYNVVTGSYDEDTTLSIVPTPTVFETYFNEVATVKEDLETFKSDTEKEVESLISDADTKVDNLVTETTEAIETLVNDTQEEIETFKTEVDQKIVETNVITAQGYSLTSSELKRNDGKIKLTSMAKVGDKLSISEDSLSIVKDASISAVLLNGSVAIKNVSTSDVLNCIVRVIDVNSNASHIAQIYANNIQIGATVVVVIPQLLLKSTSESAYAIKILDADSLLSYSNIQIVGGSRDTYLTVQGVK